MLRRMNEERRNQQERERRKKEEERPYCEDMEKKGFLPSRSRNRHS